MKAFAFASFAALTFADKPTTAPPVQCTVKGPSFTIDGDCRVAGSWPIRGVKDKESCASKCGSNSDCAAFHYYGADDRAYGDCYLQHLQLQANQIGQLSSLDPLATATTVIRPMHAMLTRL